jgi:hypothetical protein
MAEHAREAKLQIHKSGQGEITFFRFVGTIDENFDGSGLGSGLQGHLVISLEQVRRITSFGIRQWVDFVSRASETCKSIYFVDCAPRIVDQFNMVANFGGRGKIVSFFAPFRCDHCGSERLKLIQMDRDREMIRSMSLEGDICPNDGEQEYFDDDPESYLSYICTQADFEMEPQVAAFLAGRTQYDVPDGLRKTRIEKKIHDRFTCIGISGDIGEDFPVRKLAEGLEGDVVFDLAGVGQISEQGQDRWRQLLATIAPTTERILITGLPASMLERFSREQDLAEKGQALTIYLPFNCTSCGITAQLELDVAAHHDVLRFATAPELACPDCGQAVSCSASEATLNGMTELPPPAADLKTDQIIEMARKPVEPAPSTPASMPGAGPAAVSGHSGVGWPLVVVLGLVAVLGALVALVLVLRSGEGEGVKIAKPKLLEASHPRPPSWRDQTFTVKGDQVLVVGSAGFVTDKEEGFKVARAAALEELSHQVGASIRDPLWVEHVGGQFQSFRIKALDDLEKALLSGEQEAITHSRKRVLAGREQVATALIKGTSASVQPERSRYYWEKLRTAVGIRYRVWALFRVRKEELKRLVEFYSRPEEALSASAVSLFPGMAWRYNHTQGAVIIGLKPNSPLKFIGVLPGDIILSAQDRNIKGARGFKRVLNQEFVDLERTGGTMILSIKRGDAPVVKHRLKVAKKAARPGRPSRAGARRYRPGGRPGSRRPPPANIWDDNPFE